MPSARGVAALAKLTGNLGRDESMKGTRVQRGSSTLVTVSNPITSPAMGQA
jgi:hypothetical protein